MDVDPRDIILSLIKKKCRGQTPLRTYFDKKLYEDLIPDIDTVLTPLLGALDSQVRRRYYDDSVRQYLSTHPTEILESNVLGCEKTLYGWLTDERLQELPEDAYVDRYFRGLRKKGRDDEHRKIIRRDCRKVLGRLGDPRTNEFFKKGLVVGSVQSGKTENFNGVINLALDSGYRLVIVLSGMIEDLRSQTQSRINIDVVDGYKGAPVFSGENSPEQVFCITSEKTDFKKTLSDADFSLNHINILVCKKNASILKNLLLWLDEKIEMAAAYKSLPLLIVDDEADNASLNNDGHKGRDRATKINGHIRAILNLFSKKSYLGYTATPFANVLQDQNLASNGVCWTVGDKEFTLSSSLFPDDFIVLLNPPSNYIGPKRIFETISSDVEPLPLLEVCSDAEVEFPLRVDDGERWRAVKQYDDYPQKLPQSLKDAINCFILSIAVRELRKPNLSGQPFYNPHHTMLVHVSRFVLWQNKTKNLIQVYLNDISSRLATEPPNQPGSIFNHLKRVWYDYYDKIVQSIFEYLPDNHVDEFMGALAYESIVDHLPSIAENIRVLALNTGNPNDKLVYDKKNPQKVIAVGGNRLSRGFTLEGLSVTYFIRVANTEDTLLQMGRWFGYRTGYLDCCKVFLTRDLRNRFDITTRTIEELEAEFVKMEDEGKTPKQFELRVRKHPGALKVTRPSILKNTREIKWSYEDTLLQNLKFKLTNKALNDGWTFFKEDVVKPFDFEPNGKDFLKARIPDKKDAIRLIKKIPNLDSLTKKTLAGFIELANDAGKLDEWYIGIKIKGTGKLKFTSEEVGLSRSIDTVKRSRPDKGQYLKDLLDDKIFVATGKNRNIVSSPEDLSILLEPEVKKSAKERFKSEKPESNVPERVYREKMPPSQGLILFYLISPNEVFDKKNLSQEDEIKMNEIINSEDLGDFSIPLVGSVIAIPPFDIDIGDAYLLGDYSFDNDQLDDSDSFCAAMDQEE